MKLEKQILKATEGFKVTQGDHCGEDFKILPWQKKFLTKVFGNDDVSTAALSIARGGGKSTFASLIGALALDGPLQKKRSDIFVVASSFQQGCIVGRHVRAFLGKRKHLRYVENSQALTIENKESGTIMRVLGSDPRRAMGGAPSLMILDEGASWPPSGEAMYSALKTSLGKIPHSKLIAIGTRPSDELHWFSQMLNGGADYIADYSLPRDFDVSKKRMWTKSNPSLNHLPSLKKQVYKEYKEALRNPFLMQQFKSLRLNIPVSDCLEATVLSVENWKLALVKELPPRQGDMIMGLDMGGSNAMSAVACFWPKTGRLESKCFFSNIPDLKTRSQNDGAGSLYQRMFDRKELILIGGRTVPIEEMLEKVFEEFGFPKIICSDRFKKAETADALDKTKCPRSCSIVYRGMGFRDGAQDLADFRKAILNDKVRTLNSLAMTSALQSARTQIDSAGNEKICKATQGRRRSRSKDDCLVATVLAVGEGYRRLQSKQNKPTKITII